MSASETVAALLHADPAFAAGSGSFSSGLETLVSDGVVDSPELTAFMALDSIARRWATFDRVFLGRAVAVDGDVSALLAIDAEADRNLLGAAARAASRRAGGALLGAWARLDMPLAARLRGAIHDGVHLPVAQGAVWSADGLDIARIEALSGWAAISAQASAAVRLGALGHRAAQQLLEAGASLLAEILAVPLPSDAAPEAWTPFPDIATERHRDAELRLFAS